VKRPFALAALAVSSVVLGPRIAQAAEPGRPSSPPPPSPSFTPPSAEHTYSSPRPYVTFSWFVTQLVPSPELAFGTDKGESKTAFGLRWQVTPVLWSWGLSPRVDRFRYLVVDPLARMSGSLALELHFEYLGGHVDRVLARPGVKATFPLVSRGEYLAFSLGTSVYSYDDRAHVAHDVGVYTLFGVLGAVATIAPGHDALTTIATLRLRYF